HPPIEPVRPLGILRIEARQLYATARAVNEFELAHVHADVRDARAGARREEQDVTRAQGVDYGRDLGARLRLVAAHTGQPNAVPAIGILDQAGAIEPVVLRAAPDVRRADGFERGLNHVGGVPGDRCRRLRRWQLGRRPRSGPPAPAPSPSPT